MVQRQYAISSFLFCVYTGNNFLFLYFLYSIIFTDLFHNVNSRRHARPNPPAPSQLPYEIPSGGNCHALPKNTVFDSFFMQRFCCSGKLTGSEDFDAVVAVDLTDGVPCSKDEGWIFHENVVELGPEVLAI